MTTEIRRITADQGDVLRSVRLAALTDSPSAFGSTLERELGFSADEWTERAAGSASGEERTTLLAWIDGDVIGIVTGLRDEPDTVQLVSMWTAPSARRSGLGRSLVGGIVTWARTVGASSVELWVTSGNEPAQRLYESLGFVTTDDHQPLPSDPCKDEVRMRRVLGPDPSHTPRQIGVENGDG